MKKRGEIEVLARGVVVVNGQLLLCHSKGARNRYLPGGHVEFMERAADALEREVLEEMGLRAKAGRFLGAVEHTFTQRGRSHCEVNLIFEMAVRGLAPDTPPPSREASIEFLWIPLSGLARSRIEPYVLLAKLPGWLAAEDRIQRWASSGRRGNSC